MTQVAKWLSNKIPQAPVFGLVHDVAWATIAPLLAIMLRKDFILTPEEVDGTILYVSVSLVTAIVVFPLFAMRRDIWEFTTLPDVVRVALAVTVSVVAVSFIVFVINRHEGVARSVPLMHHVLLLMPLVGARVIYRRIHRERLDRKARQPVKMRRDADRVIVYGVNSLTEFYASAVSELAHNDVEIVGIVSNDAWRHGRRLRSLPVLGAARHLPHFVQEFLVRGIEINRIVVCLRWEEIPPATQKVLQKLEAENGLRIDLMDEILRLVPDQRLTTMRREEAVPEELVHEELGDDHRVREQLPAYFKLKRVIDVAVALVCAVVALPLVVLLAIVNKIALGDPVLFWQRRPGRHGLEFTVYKFRTMLAPYDADGNAIADEHRQTTLTRLVRRTRLDELPQLYNIITGEMSLIGPRPLLPKDQPEGTTARLAVPPGVTGWAQVNGGDLLTSDEKLALDLWYVQKASLWVDLVILWKTVMTVIYGDQRNAEAVREAMAILVATYPQLADRRKLT